MYERVQVQVDQVTCGSVLQTQQRCGCSDGLSVRRSCAAGDLPACAGVDVSWTPPWVSNNLPKCHRGIPCRAGGLVQIAKALTDSGFMNEIRAVSRNSPIEGVACEGRALIV